MAKSSQDMFSKKHFLWTNKVGNEDEDTKETPTFMLPTNPTEEENTKKVTDHQLQRQLRGRNCKQLQFFRGDQFLLHSIRTDPTYHHWVLDPGL